MNIPDSWILGSLRVAGSGLIAHHCQEFGGLRFVVSNFPRLLHVSIQWEELN